MLFNSLDYFLFLPIVLALYFVLPLRGRQVLLVLASLYFYAAWRWPYVSLLMLSAVVDYTVARLIDRAESRSTQGWLLATSIVFNLGVLAFFKYTTFAFDTLDMFSLRPSGLPSFDLLLPMGISFYTFQTMSYTIDVYRGRMKAERDFLKVLLYVSFFPQLVAGPIERATHLLPQFDVLHRFDWHNLMVGGRRVLIGLTKKVLIADNLARVVNQVYASPEQMGVGALLLGTWAFAFQILCDFSGYSDIAIGTARMMGIDVMENFDNPYSSRSVQEFWRRWHISLSSWLRDYLYIPLGGNRKGPVRTYVNLIITMLLGGLWHGSSWNFVIWGAIHGSWLAVERFVTRRPGWKAAEGRFTVRGIVQMFLVFQMVCVAWVFFRARTFADAFAVLEGIVTFSSGSFPNLFLAASSIGAALCGGLVILLAPDSEVRSWRWSLAGSLAVLFITLLGANSSEFIYFVF